ncbi:MAG: hypothetical protein ACI8S6_005489 [Myxococcota bacterium]|jgi:hypothetical protein
MIKIKTNPLVLAAALGLLGPAALADDDDDGDMIGGMWQRSLGTDSTTETLPSSPLPARLGHQIQLLPVENAFVIDDGNHGPNGCWDTQDGVVQILQSDAGRVTREFSTAGDALTVHTIVNCSGTEEIVYTDVYTRVS